MDFDKKIFKNKSFSDLLGEIYDNSVKKETKIGELITKFTEMTVNIGDASILAPLIASYMNLSIQTNDHLIKIAAIIQKAMVGIKGNETLDEVLTKEDKEVLRKEIEAVGLLKKKNK